LVVGEQKFEFIQSVEKHHSNDILSFCHFAIIVDKDGYLNVREQPGTSSKIIGNAKFGEVVFILDDSKKDWLLIKFKVEGGNCNTGYVHRSGIKYINTFEQIPAADYNEDFVNFILKDITVNIETERFDYQVNKGNFSRDFKGFYKYEGKFMFGTDGQIVEAKVHSKSIIVRIGEQIVKIPSIDFEDLFNPNNQYSECYLNKRDDTLYLHFSNSDGSSSYFVLFIIQNGILKERRIEVPL
jgi:Bacterial SH3 domain.